MWHFEEVTSSSSDPIDLCDPSDPETDEPVAKRQKTGDVPQNKIAPAKCWCFTWHEPPIDWQKNVLGNKKLAEYIVGEEVCPTTGRAHLQGYLEFKQKARAFSLKWPKEVHWEKAKGTRAENIAYCSKDAKYICSPNCEPPEPLDLITVLRPWQEMVFKIISEKPNDRDIVWIWEPTGKVGKSAFCKYLCATKGAVVCAGKAADMKHQISECVKKGGRAPKIVIFDVPRSSLQYVSYTGIEEIKNGCFASQKYESGMVIMNSPHVLVFANEEPDRSTMSADRWKVINLQDWNALFSKEQVC